MCHCFSFLLENPTLQQWLRFTPLFAERFESSPSTEFELLRVKSEGYTNPSPHPVSDKRVTAAREDGCVDGLLEKCGIHVIKQRRLLVQDANGDRGYVSVTKGHSAICADTDDEKGMHDQKLGEKHETSLKDHHTGRMAKPDYSNKVLCIQSSQAIEISPRNNSQNSNQAFSQDRLLSKLPRTIITSGGDDKFSLFMQQGLKGTNQDSMVVWENFLPSENVTFCGVFDGHGPHGHHISNNVRNKLPAKIAGCWQALQASILMAQSSVSPVKSMMSSNGNLDPDSISIWEEAFHNAFNLMDRDLLLDDDVDCVFSGSTAVTIVKQGNDIVLANLGDSRAVMGVKFEDSVVALQLTVDLTPNLPREADRIRRCNGRVLALRSEPFVKRVWLPHENSPGLAMARAFGDYVLKNFGVLSVPEVTHRRISKNDKFMVLATDGVWNVLSNEQVVRIVEAAPVRSIAAQAVVDAAFHAWKVKYPNAKADDCAVICMFLNSEQSESCQATKSRW